MTIGFSTLVVLVGASVLGGACGVMGMFATLRRKALVGDVLAHATLPGVVVAFLVTSQRQLPVLLLGGLASGLAAIAVLGYLARKSPTREDAAMALVLSVMFGAGVALVRFAQNRTPTGAQAGLESFLYGKAAGVLLGDVYFVAGIAVGLLTLVVFSMRELRALCFDPTFSASIGRPVGRLDFALFAGTAILVVVGLSLVGVVMIAALMILPFATARFWSSRFEVLALSSGLLGAAGASGGALASAVMPDLPTGPAIILAGGAMFFVSMLCAPHRGLLAVSVRRWMRRRRWHLREALLELAEGRPVPPRRLGRASRLGLVAGGALTAAGRQWLELFRREEIRG